MGFSISFLERFVVNKTLTTMNIDEYEPTITPTDKARLKFFSASPPATNSATNTSKVVTVDRM